MNVFEEFKIYKFVKETPDSVPNDKLFESNVVYNTATKIIDSVGERRTGPDIQGGGEGFGGRSR